MTEISNATKKAIEEKIIELDAPELINYIRTNYSDANLGGKILGLIFEKICGVNKKGFSKAMSIDDLAQINNGFRTTNGSSWARSNGSYLGDKYIVRRNKQYGNHGRIISVQLDGINHNKKINRTIPKNVQEALKGRPCCVLNIHSSKVLYPSSFMSLASKTSSAMFSYLSKLVPIFLRSTALASSRRYTFCPPT